MRSKYYKFKTDVVKNALPTGTTNTSQIKRDEVPLILERTREIMVMRGSIELGLFFDACIGDNIIFTSEYFLKYFEEVEEDIRELLKLTIVRE